MSIKKLLVNVDLPERTQRAFTLVDEPYCPEEWLWREVAMRAVLDALGHTGNLDRPQAHNSLVRSARIWFKMDDNAPLIFEMAGIDFRAVKESVLAEVPRYAQSRKNRAK